MYIVQSDLEETNLMSYDVLKLVRLWKIWLLKYVCSYWTLAFFEQERNLKAFTVAKLYFNVGELDQAIKFLDKYDSARKNAPQVSQDNF